MRRVEHDDETVTADPAVHVRDLERRRTMFRSGFNPFEAAAPMHFKLHVHVHVASTRCCILHVHVYTLY